MGCDVSLVKRCFADRTSLIDELAARDESFRDLCDDFATADRLRLSFNKAAVPNGDERLAEYVELVNCLRDEIAMVLDNAVIVPFPRQKKGRGGDGRGVVYCKILSFRQIP